MVPPSASDLLTGWEWGQAAGVPQRGAVLLTAVLPDRPPESLASMSIGERDVHLLHAHRELFGPELDCVLGCAECSAELELTLAVDDLLADADGRDAAKHPAELVYGTWRVRFRLIEQGDLVEAARAQDAAQARQVLLERCVQATVDPEGRELEGLPEAGLPPEVEVALAEELERRDVLGALDLQLTCPDCGHAWTTPLDVAGFLWAEVDGWAQRTLREVHLLAAAYGWDEQQILALSPWRRQAYLRMSGHA